MERLRGQGVAVGTLALVCPTLTLTLAPGLDPGLPVEAGPGQDPSTLETYPEAGIDPGVLAGQGGDHHQRLLGLWTDLLP